MSSSTCTRRGWRTAGASAALLALTLTVASCGSDSAAGDSGSAADESSDVNTFGSYKDSAPLYDQLPEKYRSKPIVIAMDPTFGALNSFKTGTKEFDGVNVDLAEALAEPLGTEVKLVPAPFEQIIIGVSSGRFDASMSGVTDTTERQESVTFVDYFRTQQVFFVPPGNPKKITGDDTGACGFKLSVVPGTPDEILFDKIGEQCAAAGEPAPVDVSIESVAASHLALASGRVDAVIRENSSAMTYKGEADMVPVDYGEVTYLGAIVGQDEEELADALLAGFEAIIEDGTYDRILEENGYEPITLHEPGINLASK